ncbi:MAG TPA: glycosyltransferase family 2 protein [Syntrophales bacterium]|nr:glycosyltransferase family 2 protein [Syntrophales bacterium]
MEVSVVIPVYNGERYLAEAIESVLAQTHRDFELILVDDGSTDATPAIMRAYAAEDSRVRVVTQENRGHSGAANRCLMEASCEWVARLDADDIFLPRKLELQVAALEANPRIRVLGAMGTWIDAQGGQLVPMESLGPFSEAELVEMVRRNETLFFIHSTVMMHRKTVLDAGGYREIFVQAEDTDLWNRLAEQKHLLLKMRESLVLDRFHENSSSGARPNVNRLYGEWAIRCIHARRSGLKEPSFNEYLAFRRSRSWYERVESYRRDSGEEFYQRAARRYADHNRLRAVMTMAAALAIHPAHVIPRIYRRIFQPYLMKRSEPLTDMHATCTRLERARP